VVVLVGWLVCLFVCLFVGWLDWFSLVWFVDLVGWLVGWLLRLLYVAGEGREFECSSSSPYNI